MKSDQPQKEWYGGWKPQVFCLLGLIVIATAITVTLVGRSVNQNSRRAFAHSCIANLKQIAGAKKSLALEQKKDNGDLIEWNNLIGSSNYIRLMPTCPARGIYSINPIGVLPACSLGTNVALPHVLPE